MPVGIIIPTKNKSDYLIRQLAYYASISCTHTLYIGDSSDSSHLASTQKAISKFDHLINIDYIRLSSEPRHEAITQLSQRVVEPYIAVAADDDFLVPGALEECAMFLDSNLDYDSARGVIVSFAVGLDRPLGEFIKAARISGMPTEDDSARLRLLDFLPSYWPAHLCVQRTHQFRESARMASELPDEEFQEILKGCLTITRSKSKQLDRLYLLRQTHINNSPLPDVFDWLVGPEWSDSYNIFLDFLASELVRQDNVDLEEAKEVIKAGTWSYISKLLVNGGIGRMFTPISSPDTQGRRGGLRGLIRKTPGVRVIWRMGQHLRDMNPPGIAQFSFADLISVSSPYNADFMPIYKTITGDHDWS